MGWNAEISASIKVARNDEEKRNFEKLYKEINEESDFNKNDLLKSYNVRTKKKEYIANERKNYILSQNKEFYYIDFDKEINSKQNAFTLLDSVKKFYGINFSSYNYEEICVNDMKKIIDSMVLDEEFYENDFEKELFEDFKRDMNDYINNIYDDLKKANIKEEEILDFVFFIKLV